MDIKDLFSYSNSMADWVKTNPEGYQTYLKVASATQGFTSANQLLIMGYTNGVKPVLLDDYSSWINKGYSVNDSPIYVMEHAPDTKYRYVIRTLYDVTNTNAAYNPPEYDKGMVLESLMRKSPCPLVYTDEPKRSKAEFIPDRNVIEVTSGFKSFEEIFAKLSEEYAHCMIYKHMVEASDKDKNKAVVPVRYTRGQNGFLAYSVAYMMSEKYNMQYDGFSFTSLPENWQNVESIPFKTELESINTVFKSVDEGLEEKINSMYKGADEIAR